MTEFKQQEDETIVGEDTRGMSLTHYVIAERLVALDCTYIIEDGAHKDVEYLADKLSDGWRGYHRMSPGELWSEYKEQEESFYEYYEKNLLICGLADADPLNTLEEDENGEVASYGKQKESSL
mgnify:FL=1